MKIAKADRILIDCKWEDKGIGFKALESQAYGIIFLSRHDSWF